MKKKTKRGGKLGGKRHAIVAVNPTTAPDPDATLEPLKREFLSLLEQGTYSLKAACDKIGKAPVTVWRWRKDDAAFDAAVVNAYTDSDRVRVALVEDSLFKRLVDGNASPVEMIFYLKNRAPERWKDRRENAVTMDINQPTDARDRLADRIARLAERN